jgi:hypothetical protein
VAAAAIIAALSGMACGTGEPPGPLAHEHHAVEPGDATSARVEIDMSAGDLTMNAGGAQLLEGDFDFNIPALKPTLAYAVNDGKGTLRVSQGKASGNVENKWQLSLSDTMPLELEVNLGAGDVKLDFGRLKLSALTIGLGAGDLTLDLRGTPVNSYSVRVNAGAGDTTFYLPASARISVRTIGLIGDTAVEGLEKRDGIWVNPRADASAVKIDLQVQHAIGDLKLVAE